MQQGIFMSWENFKLEKSPHFKVENNYLYIDSLIYHEN